MSSQERPKGGEQRGREAKKPGEEPCRTCTGADMESINYFLLKKLKLTVGQNWKEMANAVDQSLCP